MEISGNWNEFGRQAQQLTRVVTGYYGDFGVSGEKG